MKRILLIILLFASVKSFSQAYTPMNFDTSCYWVNHYIVYYAGIICEGETTSYIEKDTAINATSYYKMNTYFNYQSKGGNCLPYLGYIPGSMFVREDTALRQIIRYNNANPEVLLVDFGLNTGDNLNVCFPSPIDSVTTDTINNISRRLQWYHDYFNNPLSTLEGIGNMINFPNGGCGEWGTPYFSLLCYSKNGVTYYGQGMCSKPTPLSTADFNQHSFSMNFSENILSIKNNSNSSVLSVYNLLGKKVFSEKIKQEDYSKDLASFVPNGFYIVSVNTEKSKSVLKIVVK